MSTTVTFHVGDVRDVLAAMPDSSVDLLVTSPPFLALRSYLPEGHPDKHREIGSEPTPAAFLDTLLGLTADWRRVVADWGSIAVEIGDTYSHSGGAGGDYLPGGWREGQPGFGQPQVRKGRVPGGNAYGKGESSMTHKIGTTQQWNAVGTPPANGGDGWPLAKSLCGIPTLYPWCLAYGRNLLTGADSPAGQWRIRNLLTWTRPNPPVGALGDKFRPATSFVTVATVSERRWFDLDAVRGPGSANTHARTAKGVDRRSTTGKAADDERRGGNFSTLDTIHDTNGAPPLDWWDANDPEDDWQPLHRLPTQPYKGSHYAAFPVALPRRLIEAMCPREVCTVCGEPRRRIAVTTNALGEAAGRRSWRNNTEGKHTGEITRSISTAPTAERATLGWTDCGCAVGELPDLREPWRTGIVLDPFGGSGTTAVAAALSGRDAILIDIDHRNVDLARQRLHKTVRVLHEHRDGDTWTWTVEPATPTELEAIAAGQLSIFDPEASA